MRIKMFNLGFFLVLLQLSYIIKSDLLNNCNCDLNPKECDIKCCCDTLCTQSDLNVFNCFATQYPINVRKKWCLPESALFTQNTQFKVSYLKEYFCVNFDDSASKNFYQPPSIEGGKLSPSSIEQLVDMVSNSIINSSLNFYHKLNKEDSSFSSSDYVWVLFSDDNLGYLTLPQNKNQPIPVRYLLNKEDVYSVKENEINTGCSLTTNNISLLSLDYHLNNFKIIKSPNSLIDCLKNTTNNTLFSYFNSCDERFLTKIKIRNCVGSDGKIIENCKSQLDKYLKPNITSGKCINLVKSVTYIFSGSTDGINDAALDVVFFDENFIPASSPIEQSYKVFFTDLESENFNYNESFSVISGYQNGESIKAGKTETNLVKDGLTILKPDKNGNCPLNNNNRNSVKFLQNVQTECIFKIQVAYSDLTSLDKFCKDLQANIDLIILGPEENRALFYSQFSETTKSNGKSISNSDISLQSKPTGNLNNLDGVCKSVRTGATIQIAYASNGNIYGPTSSIEFISYNWDKTVDINLRCLSQYCTNSNKELSLKISAQSFFVDVSQSPLYLENKKKRAAQTKPGDFFFALTGSSNTKFNFNLYLIAYLMMIYCFISF